MRLTQPARRPLVVHDRHQVDRLAAAIVANRALAGRPRLDAIAVDRASSASADLIARNELLITASGGEQAEALERVLSGPLAAHPRRTVICDEDAARDLAQWPGRRADSVVVVLGHRDPGLSSDDHLSDESHARLARAAQACAKTPPRAVVFTGWSRTPDGLSEAEQMAEAWSEPNVPVVLETAGRNTAENAACSLPLIEAIGGVRSVTVVTSAWHIRTPYFFAPYRTRGLRVSYAPEPSRPFLRPLLLELASLPDVRRQRRAAGQRLGFTRWSSAGVGWRGR